MHRYCKTCQKQTIQVGVPLLLESDNDFHIPRFIWEKKKNLDDKKKFMLISLTELFKNKLSLSTSQFPSVWSIWIRKWNQNNQG